MWKSPQIHSPLKYCRLDACPAFQQRFMCLEVRKCITPVIAFIWEELGTCSAVGGTTGYFIALLSVLNTGTTLLSRPFSVTLVLPYFGLHTALQIVYQRDISVWVVKEIYVLRRCVFGGTKQERGVLQIRKNNIKKVFIILINSVGFQRAL